jgi:hypothetical protein
VFLSEFYFVCSDSTPNSPGGYGPRVPPIQNITENPTKVDPRLLAEGTKGYFSSQRVSTNYYTT